MSHAWPAARPTSAVPSKHGVIAVLRDGQARFLVIRRGLTLRRAPGVWCFPGGEVERGEDWSAAVEREVFEEVGLRVRARGKVWESTSPNDEFLLHWMEVALAAESGTLRPHPVEVAEVRWLTAREALRLDPLLPTLRDWLTQQTDAR